MSFNPMGGVCGMVCPDRFCVDACSHKNLDGSVEIPAVQATIVQMAKDLGGLPSLEPVETGNHRVAVVGAGPAGLGAAAMLARLGHSVEIFEARQRPGGACNLIPAHRLPRVILESDIQWLLDLGNIRLHSSSAVESPELLLEQQFDAVIVATGLGRPISLGIPGEDLALEGLVYLDAPSAHPMSGAVAVVGGGATAVDCAVTAARCGAQRVELICLESFAEMPLTGDERRELLEHGVEITGRTSVLEIVGTADVGVESLRITRVELPPGQPFHPAAVKPLPGGITNRVDIQHVIVAIGARGAFSGFDDPRVVMAGDARSGPGTVVEATASGKNAAMEVDAMLQGRGSPSFASHTKSYRPLPGAQQLPVSLETNFFGRKIRSPFLLSAAPPSDGYEQMRRAYEAGWAGGVMKTAFDGLPIHIPGQYMHVFDDSTYGNCDNVSGHPLDRVCDELHRLVSEFPDRLTIASTGGPVTGDQQADKAVWQSNTRKLEAAGAMGIEYSLSCPQGGDGTEGDIVSQSPGVTAMIVDWIMEISNPDIPKLFKLTAAVTSVELIVAAIRQVLDRYPHKKAGVTLANTFPVMDFRPGDKSRWEEGLVLGMSGAGVAPISNFTLARVGGMGLVISGNGGPMDYRAAANFLALGAGTVQFCTIVMKYGYGIVDELHNGLSNLMASRGIGSIEQLVGRAQPGAITDFMDLSPVKKLSQVDPDLCLHCGNCTRCPYMAITLDDDHVPVTDPSRCIGCGICAAKCFSGALHLRERSPEESAALVEA